MARPDDRRREGSDDDQLRVHADRLLAALEAALPGWVERSVARVAEGWRPGAAERLAVDATRAGREALTEVGPRLRALLGADVDQQATGPLELCRSAVRYPTRVLADAGIPEVARDEFSVRAFPHDVYDLAPASFADIDPTVAEPGIVWGAAKAHVVLARRRAEGLR